MNVCQTSKLIILQQTLCNLMSIIRTFLSLCTQLMGDWQKVDNLGLVTFGAYRSISHQHFHKVLTLFFRQLKPLLLQKLQIASSLCSSRLLLSKRNWQTPKMA